MPVNDPLRQAEAKTDAFDAARPGRVGSKEAFKDVELDVRIDADARIANGKSRDGTHARHVHDDASAVRCEFDRVVEEIQDEPLEPFRVALHDHGVCVIASHGDPSRLGHRLDLVDERRRERSEIDGIDCERDLSGFCLRDHQDLIDQALESVDLFELAGKALRGVPRRSVAACVISMSPAERRQRRPELVRKRSAELAHLADGVLEAFESVVEGGGHVVQLVVSRREQVHRRPRSAMSMVRVDSASRESGVSANRAIHRPMTNVTMSPCRHTGEEQKEKTFQRAIHRQEGNSHLQQVAVAVGWRQHAVREAKPSVIGVHVEDRAADRETGRTSGGLNSSPSGLIPSD